MHLSPLIASIAILLTSCSTGDARGAFRGSNGRVKENKDARPHDDLTLNSVRFLTPVTGEDCCVINPGTGCSASDCQDRVCALDSFCCAVNWDGACADLANQHCDECYTRSNCCSINNDRAGCDDPTCEDMICSVAPFCCDTQWGSSCVTWARNSCSVCADPTPSPTTGPSASPSPSPSASPSAAPTLTPTVSPTSNPTSAPTESPSNAPTGPVFFASAPCEMTHEIPISIEYTTDYCDGLTVSTHANANNEILSMIDYINSAWYHVDDLCVSLTVKSLAGSCNGVREDGGTLDPYRRFDRGDAKLLWEDVNKFDVLQRDTQGNKIFPVYTDTFLVLFNSGKSNEIVGYGNAKQVCSRSVFSAVDAAVSTDLMPVVVAHEIAHVIYGNEHVTAKPNNGAWLMHSKLDKNKYYVGFSPEIKEKMVANIQAEYYLKGGSSPCAVAGDLDNANDTLVSCSHNDQCTSGICNEGHNGQKWCDDYLPDQIGAFCSVEKDACTTGSSCNGRGMKVDKTGRCQSESVVKGDVGSFCWHDGLCYDGFQCLSGICVDKTLLYYGESCIYSAQCKSGICNEGHNGQKWCDDYLQDQNRCFL